MTKRVRPEWVDFGSGLGSGRLVAGGEGSSRSRSIRGSVSGFDSDEVRCVGGRPVVCGLVTGGSTVAVAVLERGFGLGREPGGRVDAVRVAAAVAPVARPAAKAVAVVPPLDC